MFRGPTKYLLVLGVVLSTVAPAGLCAVPLSQGRVINVKSFGAKGDGKTDDQLAIQNAFNAASASPGTTVFFPPGNYLHSNTLTGTSMSISGSAATLTATAVDHPVELSGTHISVSGMTVASTGDCDGIVFIKANGFTVTGNAFEPHVASGVFLDQSSNGIISGNKFDSASGVNATHCSKVAIDHNKFHSPEGMGLGLLIGFSTDISISDNQFQDLEDAILCGNNVRIAVIGNNIVNVVEGITSEIDTNLTIDHNLVQASGSELSYALSIFGGKNVLVTGNNVSNGATGLQAELCTDMQMTHNILKTFGMGLLASQMTNFVLSSNQLSQMQTGAIFVITSEGLVSVTGNVLRDCGLNEKGFPFPAVLYADNANSNRTEIHGNSYSGNTTGLTWFIRCLQSPPQAKVSGNVTNTLLPVVVGP